MKICLPTLLASFLLLSAAGPLHAQEKKYLFTLSAGTGASAGLKHLKQPGFALGLSGEKFYDGAASKTWWLAFDYLLQHPEAAATQAVAPGSAHTVTATYYKANLYTLTLGGRHYYNRGWLLGGGVGAGVFSQRYPTVEYSDPDRNYTQYFHAISGIGIAQRLQAGYKPGAVQFLVNYKAVWIPFRAIPDVRYEVEAPQYLPAIGFSVGYTF